MLNWPDDDKVLSVCADMVKQFEGFRETPYRDSKGIPTIGFGTTLYPNGLKVTMADRSVTSGEALTYLKHDLMMKRSIIRQKMARTPTVNQAAAMLSLAYNIGAANFAESTVLKQFNAGDDLAAANAFLLWDKITIDGKKIKSPGLLNRRKVERERFLTPDAG